MRRSTLDAHGPRIARIVRHLEAQLDDAPGPTVAARSSGLSLRQFQRVFARLTGERFKDCVRRLRLERAARELKTTGRSVLRIAVDAGFQSHEAFLRAFHRHFGHTPTEFRRADVRVPRPTIRASKRDSWQLVFAAGLRRHVEDRV
jgi:AraC family transcriptional regulator